MNAASDAVQSLSERLSYLKNARHPLGLSGAQAERFAQECRTSGDIAQALRVVKKSGPLAESLAATTVPDAVAHVDGLVGALGEVAGQQRRLASTLMYPVMLLLTVTLSAALIGRFASFTFQALAKINQAPVPKVPFYAFVLFGLSLGLLTALGFVIFRGLSLPGIGGRRPLEKRLFLESLASFARQQMPVPQAITASKAFLSGRDREIATRWAQSLESGSPIAELAPLFDAETAGLLNGSIERGVFLPVLEALVTQQRLGTEQQVPRDVRRLEALSLLAAGLGISSWVVPYYSAYSSVLTG